MKWMLILGLLACGSATNTMAVCNMGSSPLNYSLDLNVTNYQATMSVGYSNLQEIFAQCKPAVFVRAVFSPAKGELSGNSPFAVDFKLNESALSAETQAWLAQNLALEFGFKDAAVGAAEVFVTQKQMDYPILPGSPIGPEKIYKGESYFLGAAGRGIQGFGLRLYKLNAALKFISSPSSRIVNELNSKVVRIKLGELSVDMRDTNAERYASSIMPMYLDLDIKIKIPTCTMRDAHVDLGKTSLGQLKANNVANLKAFEVEFHCDAIASGAIYSRITDAFNTSNLNNQGLLLNQASLAHAAKDVGVQLLTHDDQPLIIGRRSAFLPTDESAAPIYRKALKAQLYQTGPHPSAGFVNTEATVLLDYE